MLATEENPTALADPSRNWIGRVLERTGLKTLVLALVLALGACSGPAVKKSQETPLPPPAFKVDRTRSDLSRPARPRGEKYEGLIIDTHVHLDPPGSGSYAAADLEDILETAEKAGVGRLILMPTPNEGRFPNHEKGVEEKRRLLKMGGSRVGLLCGGSYLTVWMHEALRRGYSQGELEGRIERLERELESGDCLGVGEVGPYHFDKTGKMAVVEFPMNFTPFLKVVGLAAEEGVWLDLHAEPMTPQGKSYEDEVFGGIALLFQLYPDLKLILSHTGRTNPRNARALLKAYPNLMMNLKVVLSTRLNWRNLEAITNDDGELYEDWAALMEEMPERFMVGSDAKFGRRRYPTERYRKDIRHLRRLLGSLDPAAAALIAHKNAERLWPDLHK